jgi:hypothetical protein
MDCPHCGYSEFRVGTEIYITHALSPAEAAEFNHHHPG